MLHILTPLHLQSAEPSNFRPPMLLDTAHGPSPKAASGNNNNNCLQYSHWNLVKTHRHQQRPLWVKDTLGPRQSKNAGINKCLDHTHQVLIKANWHQ